jgi:hypothetical protein
MPQSIGYTHDFLYLIMSPDAQEWARFSKVPKPRVDIIIGCFERECVEYAAGNITTAQQESTHMLQSGILWRHIPNTTWTSGRNRLLQNALDLERTERRRYNYFVFCDGDYEPLIAPPGKQEMESIQTRIRECAPGDAVDRHAYTYWECLTLDYAAPHSTTHAVGWASRSFRGEEVLSTTYADAVAASFHRQAVPLLLPYTTMFDSESWWASQAALIYRMYCVYGHSLQFDWIGWDGRVSSNRHAAYPRSGDPFGLVQPILGRLLPPWAVELALKQRGPRSPPNEGAIDPSPSQKTNWLEAISIDCFGNSTMINLEHRGFDGPIF